MTEASSHRMGTATNQLDEVWSQFEHSQRFTDGMKAELVQARRDISQLYHQFGHLTSRKIGSEDDAKTAASDINLFFLSSLMDIRADVLRLFLTLQDDPEYTGQRQAALRKKFEQTKRRLKALLKEDPIQGFHYELRREMAEVLYPRRLLQQWFGGGLRAKIRTVETIRKDFRPIRERIESWTNASDLANDAAYKQSIVVYRDLDGERALHVQHTQDLRLQREGTESSKMAIGRSNVVRQ